MRNKLLLIFIVGMFLFNIVGAESIGLVKQNDDAELYQTCNNCTYCNFTTIKYPNKTNILTNVETIKDETYYYYNLDGKNTSILGEYDYCYDCGNDVEKATGCLQFTVTPSGKISTTGDSILYSLFSVILFGAISTIFFFIFTMPNSNDKDDQGFETKIIRIKYLRVLFISINYPLIVLLFNFLNGLATNFLSLTMFAGILGFIFETLLRLAWPFTIIMIVWIVVMLVHDSNLKKQLKKFENIRI